MRCNAVDLSTFRFEPQNFEQGIMNIEVMENLIKLHNSTFLVQPARNAFGQIGDSTSMSISVPQLLFHPGASAWQAGIRYSITSVIFLNSTALRVRGWSLENIWTCAVT